MNEKQLQIQQIFDDLFKATTQTRLNYIEALLFYFTITGRGIWSDEDFNDAEKLDAFKLLNELSHRVFNILHKLKIGNDDDTVMSLYNNLKFYSEQSELLRRHINPSVLLAYNNAK